MVNDSVFQDFGRLTLVRVLVTFLFLHEQPRKDEGPNIFGLFRYTHGRAVRSGYPEEISRLSPKRLDVCADFPPL